MKKEKKQSLRAYFGLESLKQIMRAGLITVQLLTQTKNYSQYNSVTESVSFVKVIMFSFASLEQNLTVLNEMRITSYKCALVLCQFHFCQRLLLIFLHSSYQMFHINFPPTSFDANFLVSFQKIYAAFHKRVRTFLKIVYHTKIPNITWSHHSRFIAGKTVIVAARLLGVPLLMSSNPNILGKLLSKKHHTGGSHLIKISLLLI